MSSAMSLDALSPTLHPWPNTMEQVRIGILGATGHVGRTLLQRLWQEPWARAMSVSLFANTPRQRLGALHEDTSWAAPKNHAETDSVLDHVHVAPQNASGQAPSQTTHAHSLDNRNVRSYEDLPVYATHKDALRNFHVVILATHENISQEYVPFLRQQGTYVIDSSSAYRLHPDAALVVPWVNGYKIRLSQGLYAHSNCVVSPLVTVLSMLHTAFSLTNAHVCTYQSTSGAGYRAQQECWHQTYASFSQQRENAQQTPSPDYDKNATPENATKVPNLESFYFPRPIAWNVIPQVGAIDTHTGLSSEERKIIEETQRILDWHTPLYPTAVRVPTLRGHAIAVHIHTKNPMTQENVREALKNCTHLSYGLTHYMTPRQLDQRPCVHVGRSVIFHSHAASFWLCSDNLRIGAAEDSAGILQQLLHCAYPHSVAAFVK